MTETILPLGADGLKALVETRFDAAVPPSVFDRLLMAWVSADDADRPTVSARYRAYLDALSADPRGQQMAMLAALSLSGKSLQRQRRRLMGTY